MSLVPVLAMNATVHSGSPALKSAAKSPLVGRAAARSGDCRRSSRLCVDWSRVSRSRRPSGALALKSTVPQDHQVVDFRRQGDDHPSEERPGRRGRADLVLLVPPPKTMPVGTVEAVHMPGNKLLGKSTRSSRQREAGEWIERQLLSAPCLTEDRWQRIARILHRQTTSMRSGEKRPPLTAAGLTITDPSTDSMIARR